MARIINLRKALWAQIVVIPLLVVIVAGCMCCDQTQTERRTPNEGDEIVWEVTRDNEPLYQATYQYYTLPGTENDTELTIIPLLEDQIYYNGSFRETLAPEYPVTIEDLESMHQAVLDIPTEENSLGLTELADVIQILNENQVSLPTFYEWWEGEGKPQLDNAMEELFEFSFVNLSSTEVVSPSDTTNSSQEELGGGLDVAKFVWTIIKDGEPKNDAEGAFTSILNSQDKDPLHYYGATREQTGEYAYIGKDALTGTILAEVRFRVVDWYKARHDDFGGYYIPSLYVAFSKVDLIWPVSAKGQASLSQVANIGTSGEPDPNFDMVVSVTIYDWFESYTRTWTFHFKGSYGYYY